MFENYFLSKHNLVYNLESGSSQYPFQKNFVKCKKIGSLSGCLSYFQFINYFLNHRGILLLLFFS